MATNAPKTQDTLFLHIEKQHFPRRWGRVLDAGTGDHSLRWIRSLPTTGWTAVTIDSTRIVRMLPALQPYKRPTDQLIHGDWTDPSLLEGEEFDVVLVDYLIGAIDAFTPFFQDQILERLRPHTKGRLYLIGLEPFPLEADEPAHQAVLALAQTKDACRLLAHKRPYREYPSSWVERRLEEAGFRVKHTKHFPNILRTRYVQSQVGACRRLLDELPKDDLHAALTARVDRIEATLMPHASSSLGIRFGADYVITAQVR